MVLYPGDTTTVRAVVKNRAGQNIDAESHAIRILDPDGVEIEAFSNATRDGVGEYHVDFQIPEDGKAGTWKAVWRVETSEGVKTETIGFFVQEP